jgi:hypothetical protein
LGACNNSVSDLGAWASKKPHFSHLAALGVALTQGGQIGLYVTTTSCQWLWGTVTVTEPVDMLPELSVQVMEME